MDNRVGTSATAADELDYMETNSEASTGRTVDAREGSSKSSRFELMRDAIRKALEKMLKSGKYKHFAKAYSAHTKNNPHSLKNIHDFFIRELQNNILKEIDMVLQAEMIEELLGKLDKLEEAAAGSGKSMWRPSGEPAEDFLPHLLPYKHLECQKLKLEVRDIEQNATELARNVVQGRERVQELKKQLDVRQQRWKNLHSLHQDVAKVEKIVEYNLLL
uniref:polyamine-modulated factor 1 n=1 Tax=Myxine glutinosa TaxID=7769 RepID=UPI0035902D49